MSTKHDSQCLAKAADDEPIFVLRANDPTAPYIVSQWAKHNIGIQPQEKLMAAIKVVGEMQEWLQNKNNG